MIGYLTAGTEVRLKALEADRAFETCDRIADGRVDPSLVVAVDPQAHHAVAMTEDFAMDAAQQVADG